MARLHTRSLLLLSVTLPYPHFFCQWLGLRVLAEKCGQREPQAEARSPTDESRSFKRNLYRDSESMLSLPVRMCVPFKLAVTRNFKLKRTGPGPGFQSCNLAFLCGESP